jgi:hypothetical protein
LPFHIHGDANAARASELLDTRSDIHAVAVDITIAVHDVADVNSDLEFDSPVDADIVISFGQGPLDLDPALRRFKVAPEFD